MTKEICSICKKEKDCKCSYPKMDWEKRRQKEQQDITDFVNKKKNDKDFTNKIIKKVIERIEENDN